MKRIKELLIHGYAVFQENRMPVYSGYATLFIIIAIIPFIILIISVVNLIPGYSSEDVVDLLMQILPDLEPIENLTETMISALKDQTGGLLASAAAVTTLWSASKGVMAVQKGLNELDSKEEADGTGGKGETAAIAAKGRNYIRNILKRLAFTLTLIILIPVILLVRMMDDSLLGISSLLVILLALTVTLLLYARLPAKHRTLRSQIPGAVIAIFCGAAFTKLFSFFVPILYHSSLYGALAAVFLLLLWLRYMTMILFAGGVLNHVLEEGKA